MHTETDCHLIPSDFKVIGIEDMHAILLERKMISGAALPKKVDGERLSKIYENSI